MSRPQGAAAIAKAVQAGEIKAEAVAAAALSRVAEHNEALGAFTDVVGERAIATAASVDRAVAAGSKLPLAGVPFAAKNLFDVAGLSTRAGSKINRRHAAAERDATVIRKLEAAGAVLVGSTNMDEFAYGFTGENAHDGPARNPHNTDLMAGGSSAGSAAAVASGIVPFAIGSDTNGSIRVPASFCGLFGLKPTYGRLSRTGSFPLAASLDTVGVLTRSALDLALIYDAMQGFDEADAAQTKRPAEPTEARLKNPIPGIRIAITGGYFAGTTETQAHVGHVARALDAARIVSIPKAAEARAAAFLITMAEGAALHLDNLRTHAEDFDPEVRDRLVAGAMLPATWIVRAHKLRRRFRDEVLSLFDGVDAILAPATPLQAPRLGQKKVRLGGVEMPLRPNIGVFTQPFSFAGLPVASVPVWLPGARLPLGVQVVAPPWREDICLRIAYQLEEAGAVAAPVALAFQD